MEQIFIPLFFLPLWIATGIFAGQMESARARKIYRINLMIYGAEVIGIILIGAVGGKEVRGLDQFGFGIFLVFLILFPALHSVIYFALSLVDWRRSKRNR